MRASEVLRNVAVGIDAIGTALEAKGTAGAVEASVAKITASVVRAIADLMVDRTPAECMAILQHIRDNGARPITADELAAQVDRAAKV